MLLSMYMFYIHKCITPVLFTNPTRVKMAEEWVGAPDKSIDSAHPCPVPTLTQFMSNNASVCMLMGL